MPSHAATPVTTELAFRSTAADRGQLLTATELEKRTPGAGVAYLANADRSSNAKARGSHLVADIQPLDNPGFDAVRGQAVAEGGGPGRYSLKSKGAGMTPTAASKSQTISSWTPSRIPAPKPAVSTGHGLADHSTEVTSGGCRSARYQTVVAALIADTTRFDLPTTGTGQPTSSGQLFSTSIHARNGATVGHSLTLDGWYSPPDGSASQEIWDTAETGTASCNTSDNVCTY